MLLDLPYNTGLAQKYTTKWDKLVVCKTLFVRAIMGEEKETWY